MKAYIKLIIVFTICFIYLNPHSFAQTKKDSLRHWSIGIAFSPGFYPFRWFPNEENNGLPLQDFTGDHYDKLGKGSSTSKSISFSYCLNKKFAFQLTFSNTNERIKYLGINIHLSHGSSWGGTRIYNYNLNYFESNFLVRYNTSNNEKFIPYVTMGFNIGFLYKEYIEENLSNSNEFIENNNIFKFNRIVPESGAGLCFNVTDAINISLDGNICWIPLYQKRNTYEYTKGVKLSLNFGIHYNF